MQKISKNKLVPYLFHLPTFTAVTLISVFPLAYNIYLSFYNYKLSLPGSKDNYIGLGNYLNLFRDEEFWHSLTITLIFVAAAVLVQLLLGFILALPLDYLSRGRKFLTSLIMIPMMIAPLIVGLMYNFFLNPQFGLYIYLVKQFNLPLPAAPLSSSTSALIVIIITDIWQWTPFMVLMILAALKTVPLDVYEAARIDGGTGGQIFRYITLPLIRPVVVIALVLRAVEAFKVFDKPYIMTGGGPGNATEVIDVFTYREAFVNFNFSYASALCVVLYLVLIMGGFCYWQLAVKRRGA